jgi:hypothetical protein
MSKQERENFKKAVESYKKEVLVSKAASQQFLVELGIFTEKGNVRKPYKHLCIPQEQA